MLPAAAAAVLLASAPLVCCFVTMSLPIHGNHSKFYTHIHTNGLHTEALDPQELHTNYFSMYFKF